MYGKAVGLSILLAAMACAQTPIGVGPDTGFGPGVVSYFNWNSGTGSGCTAGANGICTGGGSRADTFFFTAWLPNASGLPKTSGLPVIGTMNDYAMLGPSGNIGVVQLDTFSWASVNSAHIQLVNSMSSFGTSPAVIDTPAGWHGKYSTGDNTDASAGWKNWTPWSKGGVLCMPVNRQDTSGIAQSQLHDLTITCSPDSGAHWCNPYTYYHRAGSPGCDSSNWQADGDAPKCDAANGHSACTNTAYLDSTHSSMMWKNIDGRIFSPGWVNFANQDGQAFPAGAGIESGCDPSVYTCFMWTPGDGSLMRCPNGSIQDASTCEYYTCPAITQSFRCDPKDNANWTSTYANRTSVMRQAYSTGSNNGPSWNGPITSPYNITYIKEFGMYMTSGQQTDSFMAPTLVGPWVPTFRNWGLVTPTGNFFSITPALGYTVLSTNPPHIQLTTSDNNYDGGTTNSAPEFALWDLRTGKQSKGETPQYDQLGLGGRYQFSAGNAAGTFPRRGLIWSFDLTDASPYYPWSGITEWPHFLDRGNYSAVLTGCTTGFGSGSPDCGKMHTPTGTALTATDNGVQVSYQDTSSVGHFQVAPADTQVNSTATATPAGMLGNSSYSVVGVYTFGNSNGFHNWSSIWATGVNAADDAQASISMNYTDNLLSLDWGSQFKKHWRFIANQTLPINVPYFIAVTVQAQAGCGTGCVPVAHMWVSLSGVLTDLLAGQSYTAYSGASTSAKTPAVLAGPFTLGVGVEGSGGAGGAGSQATSAYYSFLTYSRALSLPEIQGTYKSMTAKMTARGVAIGPPPPALTFTPSPTQIAVSYTAPSGSACTVEASESSSYSPLVHDVDTTLFSGSDQDNRTDGGISDGTRRVFVLGKRLWATALDAKIYSRALQAYTPYFFRITCGATVMTGSATTANIPLNSTYQDLPQLDRSTPGNTVMPAYPTSRSDSWNWPTTGAKVLPVSLSSDIPYDPMNTNTSGPFLWSEGARRVCNASILTPVTGPQGYLCQYQQGDGGPEAYYFIVPSTGERRYLGIQGGLGAFNAIDGKFYGGNGTNITVREYNGTYASGSISFTSPTVLVSNILTLIVAFDATFDPTLFTGCGGEAIGDYIHFSCSRGAQDSYAWVGSLQISTAAIISATRFDNNIRTRWCACHHILAAGYDLPMMEIIPHEFVDGGLGQGPYITTLTGNINASVTTINVAGEPACASCGTDPGVPLWRVGDVLQIGSSGAGDLEYLQITTKTSSTVLQVSRGARGSTPHSHSTSDVVTGSCDQTIIMWKFAADPHGTDTTNTNFVQDFVWQSVGGHDDATTDQLLSESGNGWVTRVGNLITEVGQPYTALIPAAFTFAGKSANCNGNACRKHPASGAPGSNFFGDFPDFDFVGTANGAPTLANVTGTLYKVTSNMPAIDPKHYSIAAVVGAEFTNPTVKSILDVSGPSVTIGGSSGDNFKMIIANVAGEGFSGSAAGDIYINVPGGSITVPSTTQTAGETHSGTAVSGGTTLTLYSVSGGCMGCNTTYYWSSYTGPFPTTSMSFTVTGFADPNNNVTATPTSIQPSTCDNSTNLCIANFSRYANGAAQIGTDGTSGRILASLPLRNTNDYPTFKVLADGSYMLYAIGSAATAEHWDAPSNVVMVKLPPFTAPDIKDRSTFLRATLPTVTPPAGTVTAAVEFGYVEQGTVAQHYCTSRREACVVVSSTVTDATPYWFESTDFAASRYTRIPCTVSCTATLPVLPSHTAFYQWKFYDSGGAPITTTGYNGVAVEDLVR